MNLDTHATYPSALGLCVELRGTRNLGEAKNAFEKACSFERGGDCIGDVIESAERYFGKQSSRRGKGILCGVTGHVCFSCRRLGRE